MTDPLFTIAMVCLNAEAHIAGAIESVAVQSPADYEFLVIDGGSTDGTLELLRAAEPRFGGRMRLSSGPDQGLYDAMNKALAADGTYIEFLGADDRLRPGALAAVAEALAAEPRPDIICGGVHVLGEGAEWDEAASHKVCRGLAQRMPVRHQSAFVRTAAAREVGGFDLRYRICSDYELYLRLLDAGCTVRLIPQVLSEFRLGGVSSTDSWATARDYRDARVAHGANPLVESLAAARSALAAEAFALVRRRG